jgi:hypothetical protein
VRANDPLSVLDVDPLRPLSNLLWGYVQDEARRPPATRRAYEYDHQYGLRLGGAAVPRGAAPRSRFADAFDRLLRACSAFMPDAGRKAAAADGGAVLDALRAVHSALAEGAHNQFGDLPSTARVEMLSEMWLLARPEIGEFLRERSAPALPEPWMDTVDRMKTLQQWSATSIGEFHDLGATGEQLLLSIRYDEWGTQTEPASAVSWARYWRPEIQRYVHAYRTVTGIDVTATR